MTNAGILSLGLMSGSSLDGIDLAAVRFQMDGGAVLNWELLSGQTVSFDPAWRDRLRNAPSLGGRALARTHADFGRYLGARVREFLTQQNLDPDLIASHGHTVFHFPEEHFTTQIGDGAAIAALTGYPVVCDFRTTDVALGGQGAPLAPLADQLLFGEYDAFLNLGGIANLSCRTPKAMIAFDITGANQILDALANQLGMAYDDGGRQAAGGRLLPDLLQQVSKRPYFDLPYPKSLGNDWVLRELVTPFLDHPSPIPHKLHTACRHLAQRTAVELSHVMERENWRPASLHLFITGGGAHNHFLVDCIREECEKICSLVIEIPRPEIVAYKEAILLALMGVLRVAGLPNTLASATGAPFDTIGGAVYQGWKKQI